MNLKRIVSIALCVLLVLTVVMVAVVASKFAPMLGALMAKPDTDSSGTSQDANDNEQDNPDDDQQGDPDGDQQGGNTHTHAFDTVKDEKEATCDTMGYVIYQCQCGETKWETTEALGHTYGAGKLVSPTCENDGYTEVKCIVCGKVTQQDKQEALGHDMQFVKTVAASCTEGGYDEYCCVRANCDEKDGDTRYTEHKNVVQALGHDWDEGVVHAPDCTEEGYTEYTCRREDCAESRKDDKKAARGHTWSDWTVVDEVAPGQMGLEQRLCAICLEKEERHPELKVAQEKVAAGEGWKYTVKIQSKDASVTVYTYTVETESTLSDIKFMFDEEVGLLVAFSTEQGQMTYTLALGDYSLSLDEQGQRVEAGSGA